MYRGYGPDDTPTGAQNGRRRRWAAVLAVTAVVVGGGAFAVAEATVGSPAAPAALAVGTQGSTTAQTDTATEAAALDSGLSGLSGHGRLTLLRRLGGLYGQFTVETKNGARTVAFERGTIASVAGDDVVVRARNGMTETWTLTGNSVVREGGKRVTRSALSSGELVFAGGPVTGGAHDIRLIVIRKAAPGTAQPTT